jgi:hypothetical protein
MRIDSVEMDKYFDEVAVNILDSFMMKWDIRGKTHLSGKNPSYGAGHGD